MKPSSKQLACLLIGQWYSLRSDLDDDDAFDRVDDAYWRIWDGLNRDEQKPFVDPEILEFHGVSDKGN